MNLSVPQDRESSFEPKIDPKRQKEISQIEDIYGFEVNQSFVSNVTNKILPDIMEWKE